MEAGHLGRRAGRENARLGTELRQTMTLFPRSNAVSDLRFLGAVSRGWVARAEEGTEFKVRWSAAGSAGLSAATVKIDLILGNFGSPLIDCRRHASNFKLKIL